LQLLHGVFMAAKARTAAPAASTTKATKKKPSGAQSAPPPPAEQPATPVPTLSPEDMQYWLVKTEPDSFSFDDLLAAPNQTTFWSGVRNYLARNMMRDDMQPGDKVIVYHSNAEPSAAVGLATVVSTGYPDHTQFDPKDHHFDPGADPNYPRWFMVDIRADRKFARPLSLAELKEVPGLEGMELLRKGSRLSVQSVLPEHFDLLVKLAG